MECKQHVIVFTFEFGIPENLKKPLKNAINSVKESPEILEKMIINVKKLPEVLEHQKAERYLQELVQQLKDFDEKVLAIKDFNMIDLIFDILFSLANFKTENFAFIEKVNNLDLKITPNEFDLLIGEIDKHLKSLPEWNNYSKMKELREKLRHRSQNLGEFESKRKKSYRPKRYEEKIKEEDSAVYSDFLFIIGLKSVYDLIAELEYTTKKLKLLDSISIQKMSGMMLKSDDAEIWGLDLKL
ncbi:hypothetical protein F8M41_016084 [Gigaspora margarita]|uniref:Uncharacterized protein n=1 Tax=Gigaspora margarita TaxID=4874 RepID=A0A8H4EMY8_GIGMA|nr:hypothetical protein F8M41_016084 [Gigaspora margarita]